MCAEHFTSKQPQTFSYLSDHPRPQLGTPANLKYLFANKHQKHALSFHSGINYLGVFGVQLVKQAIRLFLVRPSLDKNWALPVCDTFVLPRNLQKLT